MAQQGIREYDAKKMFSAFCKKPYVGLLITAQEYANSSGEWEKKLENFAQQSGITHWVVKPDQLFGKRGKYGLVGVNLTVQEVVNRISEHWQKEMTIGEKTGMLDAFLIEPFVPHSDEWYLACKTTREGVQILFSEQGGVDIEDHRDDVRTVLIDALSGFDIDAVSEALQIQDKELCTFIEQYYGFFMSHGGAYIESNPIVRDTAGSIIALDMVMKVDTCEAWKQKHHWEEIGWTKGFGTTVHPFEQLVEQADARTGASLKCSILNPSGSIALLLGGGGASVVTMDTLQQLGLLSEVINYGELSGNPSYDDNRLYTEGLLQILLDSPVEKKVLCLIGGIANFTKIDVLCRAFVDVLEAHKDVLKQQNVAIFVRRGGVNDTKGLALVQDFCDRAGIACYVADGEVYLTDAIAQIPSFL